MDPIQLPFGNQLDPTTGQIRIVYGNITFNFTWEEFLEFVSMLQDVLVVLQTTAHFNTNLCTNCGHVSETMEYIVDEEQEN